MGALRNGSSAHILPCMLRFFTVPRLALNPNLIFEIGSSVNRNILRAILSKSRVSIQRVKMNFPFG